MSQGTRASRINFDDVTEAAVGGVLRALELHRKTLLETENIVYQHPPIIYGFWIMPNMAGVANIKDITGQVGRE